MTGWAPHIFDLLVQLKMDGKLPARTVCILSYWAREAGIQGPGASLAMAPTRTGGAFSVHFDKVVGLDGYLNSDFYSVDVPTHNKHDLARSVKPIAVNPAHEALAEEFASMSNVEELMANSLRATDWCENYLQRPLVRESAPGTIVPLGLYVDGVQYQTRDTTIAFWAINLVTGRRHLLAALRKREACTCG